MSVDVHSPWTIAEEDFPARGTATEQLLFCLNYAVLAPSTHNTQPWRFYIENEVVWVHTDPERSLATVDPNGRERVISCGAALLNLRLALQHFGYGVEIERPSTREREMDPTLLVRVRRGLLQPPPTSEEDRLFHAIPRRHTNRQAYRPEPLPAGLLLALEEDAAMEGAWLMPLRDERERLQLADLIAQGDRQQWRDPEFRRELAAWVHPNRAATRDGMPGSAIGLGDWSSWLGPLVVRTFDRGDGQAAIDHQLATGSPGLFVLGTLGDETEDWLDAGQALERVLLEATANGLSTSFLNQPLEIPELRHELATLLRHEGFPQMILRMGYGVEVMPTPRRHLSVVVRVAVERTSTADDEKIELPEEPAA
jgi:nitroreductase